MKMDKIGAAWLRENDACNEGRKWALSECASLAQLAATPAGIARACGLENEVEDAQAAVAPC